MVTYHQQTKPQKMKVSIEELERCNNRYDRWYTEEGSRAGSFEEITQEASEPEFNDLPKGNLLGNKNNLKKRKELLEAIGTEPANFAYERAIGENDSVYSNFIELIVEAKRKVGRIVVKEGIENRSYATGFMVSERLLLTNWHVFKTVEAVRDSEVQFHYEYDTAGNAKLPISFRLDPATFFYSFEALDYCLVAVNPMDTNGQYTIKSIGYIYLDPAEGKLGNEREERLNIIHHPDGDYKQLSIRENEFTKILGTTIWYESDTAPGSSGSPVFNDQWQLVALHHMGVAKKNDQGNFIDKKGRVIPITADGKIDVSRIHWIANEGIRISVIREHLEQVHGTSAYVRQVLDGSLQRKDPTPTPPLPLVEKEPTIEPRKLSDAIQVSIPRSVLADKGQVNINISTNTLFNGNSSNSPTIIFPKKGGEPDLFAAESKRLERSYDYSDCEGYQTDFLGDTRRIPIPKPLPSIKDKIAKIKGRRSIILKYHLYSVIFRKDRKLPLISAINVDGDIEKRKDQSKRRDVWIRDNRIDYDAQLDGSFYRNSGFDRGHMSRREDANWGNTPADAKRNADLTCVYTNACPQVPTLNRSSRSGLWGKLEKVVLENGAIEEGNRTDRISVFSGPIFKENDRVFRGERIPTAFYKIICWLAKDRSLKVTAFKLSQIDLLGDIDLEELDLHNNIEFKEYQCSLDQLQAETHINFSPLFEFDTFVAPADELIELTDERMLVELLANA